MKLIINIDSEWIIPEERFNNQNYLSEKRDNNVPFKGVIESVIKYLYFDTQHNGISTFNNIKKKIIIENNLLEPREIIILKYLSSRTNGRLKSQYGALAIKEAKDAKYRCKVCGNPDIRTLCLDHIWVDEKLEGFKMLCQNCHSIKSRLEDWCGDKKNRNIKEALINLHNSKTILKPFTL